MRKANVVAVSIARTCGKTIDALTLEDEAYMLALSQSRHEEGTKRPVCLRGPMLPNGNFAQMVLCTQAVQQGVVELLIPVVDKA